MDKNRYEREILKLRLIDSFIKKLLNSKTGEDIIIYNNKRHFAPLHSILKPYLEVHPEIKFYRIKETWEMDLYCSRYTWKIENNQLFLIALKGYTGDKKKVDITYLFPQGGKVLADWFTGSIQIPSTGQELLLFENGKLIGTREYIPKISEKKISEEKIELIPAIVY